MNMRKRLSDHLDEQQGQITVTQPPVEDVIAKGSARNRRRQAAVTVLSAFGVVAALGVGSLAFRGDIDPIGEAAQADEPTAAEEVADAVEVAAVGSRGVAIDGNAVVAGDGAFAWTAFEGTIASWPRATAAVDDVFYVLSTAPGTTYEDYDSGPIPMALYTSVTDGVWSTKEFGTDLNPMSLSANQHGVYVVGTAPGVTNPADISLQVGRSSDQGQTFDIVELPMGLARPDFGAEETFTNTAAHLASSDTTTVVFASTRHWIDFGPLVPEEYHTNEWGVDAQPTADGLLIFDYSEINSLYAACEEAWAEQESESEPPPEECQDIETVASEPPPSTFLSWDELGIEAPDLLTRRVYVSADGGDFMELAAPFDGTLSQLVSLGSTFMAVVWPEFDGREGAEQRPEVWWSADGFEWTPADIGRDVSWIQAGGAVGDTAVLVVSHFDEESETVSLLLSDDGGVTWRQQGLPSAVAEAGPDSWIVSAAFGDLGALISIEAFDHSAMERAEMTGAGDEPVDYPQPVRLVLSTPDFETWSVEDVAAALDAAPDASFSTPVMVGASRISLGVLSWPDVELDGPGPYQATHWELIGLP